MAGGTASLPRTCASSAQLRKILNANDVDTLRPFQLIIVNEAVLGSASKVRYQDFPDRIRLFASFLSGRRQFGPRFRGWFEAASCPFCGDSELPESNQEGFLAGAARDLSPECRFMPLVAFLAPLFYKR